MDIYVQMATMWILSEDATKRSTSSWEINKYIPESVGIGGEVAVKLESQKARHPQLLYESKLYKILQGGVGIPHI
ncbi:hypothetical protein DV515_00006725, partial [Chloebia gouldiae]